MNEEAKLVSMDESSEVATKEASGAEAGESKVADSTFKVCGKSSNLPAKPSFWSKLKGILTHEVKVELTPQQQKVEDEINNFLNQEVTWKSFKDFLFQDVEITTSKKSK